MKQTLTEKILARAAGKESVQPGENIWAKIDVLLTHDVCGPGTIGIFKREFGEDAKVFDREGVVIIPDHYIHTRDEKAHRNVATLIDFAKEQDLPYFYPPWSKDYCGVCHVGLPDKGHVRPGETIVGTDSHTCTHGALGAFSTGIGNTDAGFVMGTGKMLVKVPETIRIVLTGKKPDYIAGKDVILRIIGDLGTGGATYCALEFAGPGCAELSIEDRMTICNMAVEAGAKNGIFAPDQAAIDYVKARTKKPFTPLYGDPDAPVKAEYTYDLATLVPCVAKPHCPDRYAPAADCGDVKLDRAYIGSCTGGKIEDFGMAARILNGRKVAIDTFLVPATVEVAEAIRTNTIDGKTWERIFAEAGCIPVAAPGCAACLGGPVDTFGRTQGNEVVISTTNRNFIGRMGSKTAPIYLASPLTTAASAITGHITDPREFL